MQCFSEESHRRFAFACKPCGAVPALVLAAENHDDETAADSSRKCGDTERGAADGQETATHTGKPTQKRDR